MAAWAARASGRAILMSLQGPGFRALQAVQLRPLDERHQLARTPEYGGPWISVKAGAIAGSVASAVRDAVDETLKQLGAVSQVFTLSPWLPAHDVVAEEWGCRGVADICLADLVDRDGRWRRMRRGRRSDIRSAERAAEVSWRTFDVNAVPAFARAYAESMQRLSAPPKWRLNEAYFENLAATSAGGLMMASATAACGEAHAVFAIDGPHSAYMYAARRGELPGGPSAVLWEAYRQLPTMGVEDINLGGGGEDADNPLLHFKRSFSDRVHRLQVGARSYARDVHDAAVSAGTARPLPSWAVPA